MKSVWVALSLILGGFALVMAGTSWTVKGSEPRGDLARELSRKIGFVVKIDGPVTLKLLPRPRVQIAGLSLTATDGAIDLSAPSFSGELDIPALMMGRWRLVSATLSNPTATIDLDAMSRDATAPSDASPFRLSVRSGLFRLVSQRLATDTIVTDVGATIGKAAGRSGGFSASGSAIWRAVPAQFTIRLGEAPGVTGAPGAPAFVQISSAAGSFSASGHVSGGPQPQFAGRVSASVASPNRLFASFGLGPCCTSLQRISLSGEAVATIGDLSLSDAALRLNANAFEGTLGYHTDHGRGLIEGTLAANRFDLGDLTGLPMERRTLQEAYRTKLGPYLAGTNVDLRVSVGELRLGTVTATEVALSLLSRERSLEVTLDEALAFGGVVKARVLAAQHADDIEAHAEMALSDLDLGTVGVALAGEARSTGTLTGKVGVEGHGTSLSEIVPTLAGDGQVSVANGEFMGMSVSQALRRLTRRLPFGLDQPGQVTAFAGASSMMQISKGTIHFIDGKVTGPGIAMAFTGQGDLPRGKVDIVAVASQTDASGTLIAGKPGLPIEVRAGWDEPITLMEHNYRLPIPTITLPGLDPQQIFP